MQAVIYCRISGEDQSVYGLSSQEQYCRELAQQAGYDVLETFIDDGFSSERLDRPGLEKLRDLVRAQAIHAVIVHSPDRLTRLGGHLYLLEAEFKRYQVRLLYCGSSAGDDTPEGRLTSHVRAAISEFELETIRERTRRGKRARAHAGLPQLGYGIPYGYQYRDNQLVIDPIEAAIVKETFRLRIQGVGAYRIAKLLTLRGVPTKRGRSRWHPSTLT
jgi:site-specific DNA recombinase